jgi:DNA-directed RNA polymerase specialized sigma subunit
LIRKDLEQYLRLQLEIKTLESRIDKLRDREIEVISGKVKASMSEFPYTEYRVGVLMEEPKASTERDTLIAIYERRIIKARELSVKIETFIDGIEDCGDRLVFQYRYIDGLGTLVVAEKLNYTKGRISQIIGKYIKD